MIIQNIEQQLHGANLNASEISTHEFCDFSSNINPLGMVEGSELQLNSTVNSVASYPEINAQSVVKKAQNFYKLKKNIKCCIGNGANQLIHLLPQVFVHNNIKRVIIVNPCFSEYELAFELFSDFAEIETINFLTNASDNFQIDFSKLTQIICENDLVIISNPSTPAGQLTAKSELKKLISKHQMAFFIIDESFIDFYEMASNNSFLNDKDLAEQQNILIIKSMTKIFAIAGVRVGFAFSSNQQIIDKISALTPAWSVNSFAINVMLHIFKSDLKNYLIETKKNTKIERNFLKQELAKFQQLQIFDSAANYLLIRYTKSIKNLQKYLIENEKILIRNCENFHGLDNHYFRIAVKSHHDNEKLITAFEKFFGFKKKNIIKKKSSLMFQGTCSNAGKSILTSAMCRILAQDGIKVAPFKAQNMALNSFVTSDDKEIGRAQALQAMAAKTPPEVRMNPILLKPTNDLGSQVIVMGKATETLRAKDYYSRKKQLFSQVCEAYDSLADDYDCVILEGAGSPGEVNLKKNDIVNMNMASYANSNVLLVGDIDRGGVYASFIGTYATFNSFERELLKGFIVNKFRGDASLLDDAHQYLQKFTNKPCLGVIPTYNNIRLPEEDSVSFYLNDGANQLQNSHTKKIDVAVIALKHISNFTDIAPLEIEEDLIVRKVANSHEFGSPDVVIIPGSKNVLSDLKFLTDNNLDKLIIDHAVNKKGWVIGICGGLQICGQEISDSLCIESNDNYATGLNLLPISTTMEQEKTLHQTIATLCEKSWHNSMLNKAKIAGYEIHHGLTKCQQKELITMYNPQNSQAIGFAKDKVWTTYLHGVFDDDNFRRLFFNIIREDLGLKKIDHNHNFYNIDQELDKLADHVRSNVNMTEIYKLLGI
ncbi:cobyric acid synthase [Lentisphaerota bacterium WC36G]|nr:cobyric acid synthase [Lentisphaerae bacterium WC36]